MSELKHDFVRTFVARLESADWERLETIVDEMAREGNAQLEDERVAPARRRVELKLDCRYIRQYHEVSFVVPRALVAARDAAGIARIFHTEHERLYGYSLEQEATPIEIINVRVQAIGSTDKPGYRRADRQDAGSAHALKGRRAVYVPEAKAFQDLPIYDGHSMSHGNRVDGPAMIEQATTAIFVDASFDCVVDALGSFVLFRKGREDLVREALDSRVPAGAAA